MPLPQLERAVERYRLQNAGPGKESRADTDVLDSDTLAELAAAYERRLEARAAVDYPSMLTLPLRLLDANQQALRVLQDAYHWVVRCVTLH